MLLIQKSKVNSEPGQAYKIGFLAKTVNGLKFLRLIWWTLRVYLFEHLDQWYEWSNWSENWKKHLFRTFQSLGSWPIGSRIITRFLQLLGSLASLAFHSFLVSISFSYTSRNPMSMEFPRKHKWEKSETYNYVMKSTSGSCEWMAALISYPMAGSVGSPKFIYLSINISDHWPIFPNK